MTTTEEPTTETKPDHQLAREEATALLAELGITCEISAPLGHVQDGWPCIGYSLRFSRGPVSVLLEYKLGVGHVNPPYMDRHPTEGIQPPWISALSRDEQNLLWHWQRKPGAQFTNKDVLASVAAKLAIRQKVQPLPAEVLATYCRDAQSRDQSFEDWASDLGHDADSRKAESIYRACCDGWQKVIRLLGKAQVVEQMAELSNRF